MRMKGPLPAKREGDAKIDEKYQGDNKLILIERGC